MGIFSLAGAAGFTGGLQKAIDEDKAKMFKKIEARTKLYTDDALAARKTRRERTALVRDQYNTATTLFGGDAYAGNLAESIAKLPPDQFAQVLKTYQEQKAVATAEGKPTDLVRLGYIDPTVTESIKSDMVADPTGGGVSTSDITAKGLDINVDDAVDRVMGKFGGTSVAVDRREQETMRSALRKSFGSLSEADITTQSERDAAANLQMSVADFRKLVGPEGIRGTGAAVPGVRLSSIIDPTTSLALQTAKAELDSTREKTKGEIASTADTQAATEVRVIQKAALEEDNKTYPLDPSKPVGPDNPAYRLSDIHMLSQTRYNNAKAAAEQGGAPLPDVAAARIAKATGNLTTVIANGGNLIQVQGSPGVYIRGDNAQDIDLAGIQMGEALFADVTKGIRLGPSENTTQEGDTYKGNAFWGNTVNSSRYVLGKIFNPEEGDEDNTYKEIYDSATTKVQDELKARLEKASAIKRVDDPRTTLVGPTLDKQLQQIGSTRAGTLEAIVKRHINMNRRTDTSALSQKLPDGTDVTEFVDGVLAQLSGSPTVAQVDQAILDAYEKL